MDNSNSPLDTLRQLKEMLDSGALTPTEFEALKKQLVFGPAPTTPAPPAAATPATPPAPTLPVTLPPPVAEQHSPMFEDVAADETPTSAPPVINRPTVFESAPVLPPVPVTSVASATEVSDAEAEVMPDWAAANSFPAVAEEPPARNPLALILSIGGVLVFLAVVAYLSLNRPPSERISSTSMTAADSTQTVIETGPQAEQLPQTAALPETIRVAPTNPAPPVQARPALAPRDSAATAPTAAPTDSAAGQ